MSFIKKVMLTLALLLFLAGGSFVSLKMLEEKLRSERMMIEPFGIKFGHSDIKFLRNITKGQIANNNAFDHFLPFPVTQKVFERLPEKGICKQKFGKRLIQTPKTFIIEAVPKPLKFDNFLDEGLIYKIDVNPIMGIYGVTAELRPQMPQEPYWEDLSWSNFVYEKVNEKVLPVLKDKYSTILSIGKSDMLGRFINIGIGKNHHPRDFKFRTNIYYSWDPFHLLDWIDESDTEFAVVLRRCINEEIKLIETKISDENETARKVKQRDKQVLEVETRKRMDSAL